MVTVFTPTYNRAYIIDNLYQSLLAQTSFDFEWLVIDDGSTDETEQYFNSIILKDNPFTITYVKQVNGGKHRAINAGVKLAKGEVFFIVDSDDYLTNDAIKKVTDWVSDLDLSKKWAGVSGAKGYADKSYIGKVYEKAPFIDAKNTEREKLNLVGDKAEAYFTKVLRDFPFPEIDGEKFLTEEVVWNRIAKEGYYIRWYKDIIYICDYLDDGLTKNNLKNVENPKGLLLWAKGQFEAFPGDLRIKVITVYEYYDALKKAKSLKTIAKDLGVCSFFVLASYIAVSIRKKVLCES